MTVQEHAMRPQAAYDISVLGLGHRQQRSRTGVFRVVEEVALQLMKSPEIGLQLWSGPEYAKLRSAIEYLDCNLLGAVPVNASSMQRCLQRLASAGCAPRLLGKAVHWTMRRARRDDIQYNRHWLKDANIFHSPYFQLPPTGCFQAGTRKFITVFDLIPILHPEYFKSDANHPIKKLVLGLNPQDWVICISEYTRSDLLAYRPDLNPEKVFAIPLAASESFYPCSDQDQMATARRTYGVPNAPYVLGLSTLEPRKNIAQTIRCFARLITEQKIDDLNLVLAGVRGWDVEEIFSEVKQFPKLEKRIFVTGYVADKDLAALYSGALAFVYPSFYEGFGLPPLEAMQCGVPTITSNTSSLPEVVGDAGIMVAPTDGDALCDSLWRLYSSAELRANLSAKARDRAKQFTWHKTGRGTIAAYEVALSS